MVAVGTVKTEDGKVSCETPEGTVINININQRSCMDSLLDAVKNVKMVKKDGQCNHPAKVSASWVHLGVGVSFMSLGFIGVMLAIIINAVGPDLYIRYSGTHYWTGFPFLIVGVLNVVAYKYPNAFWVVVSYIALLGCLGVSIAGTVYVANDINSFGWRWNELLNMCDKLRQNPYRYGYQTEPPRYDDPYYALERCKSGFQEYKNFVLGLLIMSLMMMIWGICVSAITLLYRLKLFFNACKFVKAEEDKGDDLLSPNPAQDIIIA